MNARSISLTFAVASLLALFVDGCAVATDGSDEYAGSTAEAMQKRPSPGDPGNGGIWTVAVQCARGGSFATDGFQSVLGSLGCGIIDPTNGRFTAGGMLAVRSTGSGHGDFIAYCPYSSTLASFVSIYSNVAPVDSVITAWPGEPDECNQDLTVPSGFVEVSFDPDCSGSGCGSVRRVPQ